MKSYVICILVFYFTTAYGMLAQSAFDQLKIHEAQCKELSGLSDCALEYSRRENQIQDNAESGNFTVCMLKKINVMNNDGSINPDTYSYQLVTDNPLAYDKSNTCRTLTGKDFQETATKIANCLIKSSVYIFNIIPNPAAKNC